jgi:quercetin dioxygenase-like cupin family protein
VRVSAGSLAWVPPGVVHGFRNASDGDMRYLNFHAPGCRFADYMRSIRDGDPITYDQFDPPADGGAPASEAVIGEVVADESLPGLQVRVLADVEAITVAELVATPGPAAPTAAHVHDDRVEFLYVLDGGLALVAGGGELRVPAGSWVQVPAGVEHVEASAAGQRLRALRIHVPA